MFCQSCGAQFDGDAAVACIRCGYVTPGISSSSPDVGEQIRTSLRDAFDVLKKLAVDPVGGLGAAYAGLGEQRALRAGVTLCIAFALACAAGLVMGASQIQRLAYGALGPFGGAVGGPRGLGGFLTTAFQALTLPAAIAVVSLALRKMGSARPPVAADMFTAGAAVAPLGIAVLLSGIIGVANVELVLLLLFFALAYLVLMLYAGLTTVGTMSTRAAGPAVPATILLAGWLCKVIIAAFV